MINRMESFKNYLFILLLVGTIVISGCASNPSNPEFNINQFVKENYKDCDKPEFCNNLVMVNCGAEVDGPLYYLNKNTGEEISVCGGACWHPQGKEIEVCETRCPPKEWDCE